MSYKCGKCGDIIETIPDGLVRCPRCAYKVLYKLRQPVSKKVKAR
ncbi:DNA-directed RNA polymerase subunit P [Candidatus Micrarchaeota archaeon]|nr:DNA-directed RNA polymerase subunit P [Candidatus Micrarchaeota archaeon]MBU1930334.1 DNA-directed RNA polymerase subunit P [Candidatus Micrarchaeota archaeon]